MDKKTLEVLLQQNLDSMKMFVEMLLNNLRDELKELRKENVEIKQSLEFTQEKLSDAEKLIASQKKKLEAVDTVGVDLAEVADRVRIMEDYSRRNNIIFDGIEKDGSETEEQLTFKIQKILTERLGVTADYDVAHRLGDSRNGRDRPRPVIVRFKSFSDRQACMRASFNLRGTNIYLNDDVGFNIAGIYITNVLRESSKMPVNFAIWIPWRVTI